jgi:hypothetical protein
MAFTAIDATTPAGTDKKKFGDDRIREFKEQVIANLSELSGYPDTVALRGATWTTATRPTTNIVDRLEGYNSDIGAEEYYDAAAALWKPKPLMPAWSVATRPTTPLAGCCGYNTDLAVIERWSGSAWIRVSGGMWGDIGMWTGAIADIPTKKPGWVLADGVTRTHPEGGTFTPPNLRDRFIVGAGTSYGVGATGGEAFHTLSWNEMPVHDHPFYIVQSGSSTPDPGHGLRRTAGNDGAMHIQGAGWGSMGTAGGGLAHESRPPYYALCYLYKL